MELRREVLVSIGTLVLFSVLLALGTIGLLGRMGPAIGHILEDNVPSAQAGEELILVLAYAGGRPANDAGRKRFATALARARANITMDEEVPVVADLEKNAPAALGGNDAARAIVLSRATRLVALNLAAMHRADARAQRLGAAGAWIAVFIALVLCALGILLLRRLNARIVTPLEDLEAVVRAASGGDRYRRCRPFTGPRELGQTLQTINEILDERLTRDGRRHSSFAPPA